MADSNGCAGSIPERASSPIFYVKTEKGVDTMKKPAMQPVAIRQDMGVTVESTNTSTHRLLQEIRDKTLHERLQTGKTIAELNALRDEIGATIAFLKAQRS